MLRHRLLLIAIAILLATTPGAAQERRIFVTSNGWHSGIVVARGDVSELALPEAADFPDAPYLEFGWGDAVYYPTPRPGLGLALGAILPGPAVLHLVGLPDHPARVFPSARVVELSLSRDGLKRLLAHVAASIERGGAPRAQSNAAGLYAFSRFYPATGRFHLFNTCNTWTARTLQAAGLAIEADGVQTVDDLMARLAPLVARP